MPINPAQKAQIALLVIKKVQIPALDENVEVFVMHMTSHSLNLMLIDPARKAQIVLLVIKEVQILSEYSDFLDIFLEKEALILLEVLKINQYAIEVQKC